MTRLLACFWAGSFWITATAQTPPQAKAQTKPKAKAQAKAKEEPPDRNAQLHAVVDVEKQEAAIIKADCSIVERSHILPSQSQAECQDLARQLLDRANRADEFAYSQTNPKLLISRIHGEADAMLEAKIKASVYCSAIRRYLVDNHANITYDDCDKSVEGTRNLTDIFNAIGTEEENATR